MSIHFILFWLLVTAAFGQSDLGLLGVLVAMLGLIALAVAIVAILLKPSWRLLWLALPIAVTHIFLQIVCVWLIGDHHEAAALSAYAAVLLAALVVLHEFLAAHGGEMGAHVITGAAAFIVAILATLMKESFI